jgi:hypothetical protein
MLQDNTLIFFESKTAPSEDKKIVLDGSSYGRDFIFCTIPAGVTALTLTIKASKDGENFATIKTAVANATDIKRGIMGVATPLAAYKAAQVVPTITGNAEKELVCGITDALDNTEVFYES